MTGEKGKMTTADIVRRHFGERPFYPFQKRPIRREDTYYKEQADIPYKAKYREVDYVREIVRKAQEAKKALLQSPKKSEKAPEPPQKRFEDKVKEALRVADFFILVNESNWNQFDDEFYLLSKKWFDSWKSFVAYDYIMKSIFIEKRQIKDLSLNRVSGSLHPNPGPVSNETLLLDFRDFYHNRVDTQDFANFPLREGLRMDRDFLHVPRGVWQLFKREYGGQEVKRYSIVKDKLGRVLRDPYLPQFKLIIVRRLEQVKFPKWVFLKKKAKLGDLKLHMPNMFQYLQGTPGKDMRLWLLKEDAQITDFVSSFNKSIAENIKQQYEFPGYSLEHLHSRHVESLPLKYRHLVIEVKRPEYPWVFNLDMAESSKFYSQFEEVKLPYLEEQQGGNFFDCLFSYNLYWRAKNFSARDYHDAEYADRYFYEEVAAPFLKMEEREREREREQKEAMVLVEQKKRKTRAKLKICQKQPKYVQKALEADTKDETKDEEIDLTDDTPDKEPVHYQVISDDEENPTKVAKKKGPALSSGADKPLSGIPSQQHSSQRTQTSLQDEEEEEEEEESVVDQQLLQEARKQEQCEQCSAAISKYSDNKQSCDYCSAVTYCGKQCKQAHKKAHQATCLGQVPVIIPTPAAAAVASQKDSQPAVKKRVKKELEKQQSRRIGVRKVDEDGEWQEKEGKEGPVKQPTQTSEEKVTTEESVEDLEMKADRKFVLGNGISNIGNSCYISAVVQALVHIPVFKYLIESSSTETPFVQSFKTLIYQIFQGPSIADITPFKEALSSKNQIVNLKYNRVQFAGKDQFDAQEFIQYLFEFLNQDLGTSLDSDGRIDIFAEVGSFLGLKRLFEGCLSQRIVCESCGYQSARSDLFNCLSLPVEGRDEASFARIDLVIVGPEVGVQKKHGLFFKPGKYPLSEIQKRAAAKVGQDKKSKKVVVLADIEQCKLKSFFVHPNQEFEFQRGQQLTTYAYEVSKSRVDTLSTIHFVHVTRKEYIAAAAEQKFYLCPVLVDFAPNETIRTVCFKIFQRLLELVRAVAGTGLPEDAREAYEHCFFREEAESEHPYQLVFISQDGSRYGIHDMRLNKKFNVFFDFQNMLRIEAEFSPSASFSAYESALDRVLREPVQMPKTKAKTTIEECVKAFARPERLEEKWHCEGCQQMVWAVKHTHLLEEPPYLILALKRMSYQSSNSAQPKLKVDTLVKCKSKLKLSKAFSSVNPPSKSGTPSKSTSPTAAPTSSRYTLMALIQHVGQAGGGHYVCLCRDEGKGEWWKFDDSTVKRVQNEKEGALQNQNNYLAVYRRVAIAPEKEEEKKNKKKRKKRSKS